jgi:hypothetical protein
MDPLQLVNERQGIWSATATRLKSRYDGARRFVLALSIAGALLATVAGQLREPQHEQERRGAALAAGLCFAIVTFTTARALGKQNATTWLRARAASEALKKEGFRYAAGAEPYEDPATRRTRLNAAREEVERGVDEIIGDAAPLGKGSTPTSALTPEEYIKNRVEKQIVGYFEPKANVAQRAAARWRWIEAALALAAACLTTAAGVVTPTKGVVFDIAALTGVLTTVASAVVAHIAASRYDFTVANYRATARRLRSVLAEAPESFTAPSPEWSAFVNACEAILWDANNTWLSVSVKAAETVPAASAPRGGPAGSGEGAAAAGSERPSGTAQGPVTLVQPPRS